VLGQLRVLRAGDSTPAVRDGLRLLRQSGDAKAHALALAAVRANGPLSALTMEAITIARFPNSRAPLTQIELATLQQGAQVLNRDDASLGLDLAVASLGPQPDHGPRRWSHPATKLQHAFEAAAALAPVAERTSELAGITLDSLLNFEATNDDLLTRAHVSALQPLDWDEVSVEVKSRWRNWLEGRAAGAWDGVADLVSLILEVAEPEHETPDLSLQLVVNRLNEVLVEGKQADKAAAWLRSTGGEYVASVLADEQAQAANGMFSWGGYEAADVAVAIIQFAQADLWTNVVESLVDTRLPRNKRTRAFERIANNPDIVPTHVRATFADHAAALLTETDQQRFFDTLPINPFPEALRALTAMGLLTSEQLVPAIASMSAGTPAARLEAARTLSVTVRTAPSAAEWVVSLALQLSNDTTANVKAEAGRTLAIARDKSTFAETVIDNRLQELLHADGVLVPLLTLRGLKRDVDRLPGAVRQTIDSMRREHPVYAIRRAAEHLLTSTASTALPEE
jgi:hypothetical protein